jgi:hypothetical protein
VDLFWQLRNECHQSEFVGLASEALFKPEPMFFFQAQFAITAISTATAKSTFAVFK